MKAKDPHNKEGGWLRACPGFRLARVVLHSLRNRLTRGLPMSCHSVDTGRSVCRTLCHTALLTRSVTDTGARTLRREISTRLCPGAVPAAARDRAGWVPSW